MVLVSSLQLAIKKLPLAEFQCCIKEDDPQFSKKTNKVIIPFPTTRLCQAGFPSPTLMKTTYRDSYVEVDTENPTGSIKADKTELCKNVKQCHSSH